MDYLYFLNSSGLSTIVLDLVLNEKYL